MDTKNDTRNDRGELPYSVRKVIGVVGDMAQNMVPDVAVRRTTLPTCPFCRRVLPDHTRDCLDYGEQEWEREAERRDQMDSLEYWR
jgi:hypothetical protein